MAATIPMGRGDNWQGTLGSRKEGYWTSVKRRGCGLVIYGLSRISSNSASTAGTIKPHIEKCPMDSDHL